MPTIPTTDSDSAIPPEEKGPFVIVRTWRPDILWENRLFPTRLEAEAWVSRYYGIKPAQLTGKQLEIRPCTWREREAIRLATGVYKVPVWHGEAFWLDRSQELIDHYAHRSLEDPNLIAFTENDNKGERDIQKRMKAGRYLKRFFPELSAKKIAFLAEWAQRGQRPAVDFGVLDLKFAKTPAEIEHVYANGPDSCMHGEEAVGVYGAGDLAIAYLEPRDPSLYESLPQFPARALVWPEKKAMGRIYPTVDNWSGDGFASSDDAQAMSDWLFDALKAEGYESFYEKPGIFDGARLLARPHPDDDEEGDRWQMPYLDNNRFDGDGADGYFRLKSSGCWSSPSTDGEAIGPWRSDNPTQACSRCNCRVPVADLVTVGTDSPRDPNTHCCTDQWCPVCVEQESFTCAGSGLTFDNYISHVTRRDGSVVTQAWNDRYGDTTEAPPTRAEITRHRDARGRFVSAPTQGTLTFEAPSTTINRVRVNVFAGGEGILTRSYDIEF